jgi:dCTP deaminase
MILVDCDIQEHRKTGHIVIEPFRDECLGSNSYDVHLGSTLATYSQYYVDPDGSIFKRVNRHIVLDAKEENKVEYFEIPDEGFVIEPGILYLGVTEEYTETRLLVPWIDGKSSGGRLGISIHATAGRGDVAFCGHWTLEISCIQPVRIYKGMPIGQLTYLKVSDLPNTPYSSKESAKYNNQGPRPVPSAMWKNFDKDAKVWK